MSVQDCSRGGGQRVAVGVCFWSTSGRRELAMVVRVLWAAAVTSVVAACSAIGHAAPPDLKLSDVTPGSGIQFVHTIGDDKMTNIVESTGVGCALLDYDGDGWLDIYLVNGVHLPGVSDPSVAGAADLARATDRLYRNRGDWTFEDVTSRVGILPGGYGMGVTVADYDNDGRRDSVRHELRTQSSVPEPSGRDVGGRGSQVGCQ